jgi:hypothetical protein
MKVMAKHGGVEADSSIWCYMKLMSRSQSPGTAKVEWCPTWGGGIPLNWTIAYLCDLQNEKGLLQMEEATVSLLLSAAVILLLSVTGILHADANPRERPLLAHVASGVLAAGSSEILLPPVNQAGQAKHPNWVPHAPVESISHILFGLSLCVSSGDNSLSSCHPPCHLHFTCNLTVVCFYGFQRDG